MLLADKHEDALVEIGGYMHSAHCVCAAALN